MMRLDNSKRMAALKGMLKEEKKKKKDEKDRKKSSKSSSSVSTTSSNGSTSRTTSSKLSKSSSTRHMNTSKRRVFDQSDSLLVESSMEFVNPKNAIQLQNSWESLRQVVEDYEMKIGEEVFLAMLEIDPTIRKTIGITSLRSTEFEALCKNLTGHIDSLVNTSGPFQSLEFDDLDNFSKGLERDNIPASLFADAVPLAMKKIIGPENYTEEVADAWGFYFVKHVSRMTADD